MEPVPPGPSRVLVLDVYADESCTVKPSGLVSTIYVRVTNSNLVTGGFVWGSAADESSYASIIQDAEYGDCYFEVWIDFVSPSLPYPLADGVYMLEQVSDFDVTGYMTEFYIDL